MTPLRMSRPLSLSRGAVAASLLLACTPSVQPAPQSQLAAQMARAAYRAESCPFDHLALEGQATNTTAGKSTGVTMEIACHAGALRAVGRYDSVNLFGRFDIEGKLVPNCTANRCVSFRGVLDLGDDGSGFPSGTQAPYSMTLSIFPDEAHGTYEISAVAGYMRAPQHGTLNLHPVRKEPFPVAPRADRP